MNTINIAVIVGSLRRDSLNRKLADALAQLAPSDFCFSQVKIDDIPLYNQDDDHHQAAQVLRMKEHIQKSQGLLFVTPEYNRSIPGVFKNVIDHASRPSDKNVWNDKPAGMLGASVGTLGTAMAQQHLRNILSCLNVQVLCQPEVYIHAKEGYFDVDGRISAANLAFVQGWMDHYVAWIRMHVAWKHMNVAVTTT